MYDEKVKHCSDCGSPITVIVDDDLSEDLLFVNYYDGNSNRIDVCYKCGKSLLVISWDDWYFRDLV